MFFFFSTQERRAARRELKTLAKAEAVGEEEQARRLAELELREQEELLHSQLSDTSQVGHGRQCALSAPACLVISSLSVHAMYALHAVTWQVRLARHCMWHQSVKADMSVAVPWHHYVLEICALSMPCVVHTKGQAKPLGPSHVQRFMRCSFIMRGASSKPAADVSAAVHVR